jgi:hypothetical protein
VTYRWWTIRVWWNFWERGLQLGPISINGYRFGLRWRFLVFCFGRQVWDGVERERPRQDHA